MIQLNIHPSKDLYYLPKIIDTINQYLKFIGCPYMKAVLHLVLCSLIVGASACTSLSEDPLSGMREIKPVSIMDAPDARLEDNSRYSREQVNHGKYLVELLGCGTCHSDGALVGMPVAGRHLAGSSTGIAYSNPIQVRYPGVIYPPNLTPDRETGIGRWDDEALSQLIREGINPTGGHALSVMPWPAYSRLTEPDIESIVAYLRSLPPVNHRVPDKVSPGERASAPFVYFGVYQSLP
jgi:mono/diheme cytochrome c family protein